MAGLSGAIGGPLAQTLESILAQQLAQQRQAEAERAQRAQEALSGRRLDLDASQHADLLGLRGRELDQRASEFDAETEQGALDALRGDRDRMDQRLTRLTKEDEVQTLIDELEAMEGLSDGQKAAAIAAARSGRDINPGDLVTERERQQRRKEALGDEIALVRAREQAQRDFTERDGGSGRAGTAVTDDYSAERETRVLQSIDELMGQVDRGTVGMGSLLSSIPESDARSFRSQLNTLKSNIAFNELTQMRAASKTGGALGNVSNVELALLESALGALDAGQSPEQFKQQLAKIRGSIERWQRARTQRMGPEPAMGRTGAPLGAPTGAPEGAPGGGARGRVVRGPDGKLVRVR